MVPAVYDQTSVEIEAKHDEATYGLRVSGSVLKEAGWRAVYGAQSAELAGEEDSEQKDVVEDGMLPELEEGESLTLMVPPGVVSHHKQTEPPPYFNEASLVKKLEEEGIGRPSTYAEIISKVQARDYVNKVDAKLVPSELGRLVIEKLVENGFDLADIGFTRQLEEDLDAVAESRAKRLDVLAPFHERLQAEIAKVLEDKGKWWPEPEPLGEKCPECGEHELMKRWGRNGPFIGCHGLPRLQVHAEHRQGGGVGREPRAGDDRLRLRRVRREDDEALGSQRVLPGLLRLPEVQEHHAGAHRREVPEVQDGRHHRDPRPQPKAPLLRLHQLQ